LYYFDNAIFIWDSGALHAKLKKLVLEITYRKLLLKLRVLSLKQEYRF
jgi:hypothetical protein